MFLPQSYYQDKTYTKEELLELSRDLAGRNNIIQSKRTGNFVANAMLDTSREEYNRAIEQINLLIASYDKCHEDAHSSSAYTQMIEFLTSAKKALNPVETT